MNLKALWLACSFKFPFEKGLNAFRVFERHYVIMAVCLFESEKVKLVTRKCTYHVQQESHVDASMSAVLTTTPE